MSYLTWVYNDSMYVRKLLYQFHWWPFPRDQKVTFFYGCLCAQPFLAWLFEATLYQVEFFQQQCQHSSFGNSICRNGRAMEDLAARSDSDDASQIAQQLCNIKPVGSIYDNPIIFLHLTSCLFPFFTPIGNICSSVGPCKPPSGPNLILGLTKAMLGMYIVGRWKERLSSLPLMCLFFQSAIPFFIPVASLIDSLIALIDQESPGFQLTSHPITIKLRHPLQGFLQDNLLGTKSDTKYIQDIVRSP